MKRKIFFITPYPTGESPSQRFRFEQYFDILEAHGYRYSTQSFFPSQKWRIFYKRGAIILKLWLLFKGFLKRVTLLFQIGKYDWIFIHREASPIGPPMIEWCIARLLRKRVIFDFDDAIWTTDNTRESLIQRGLKWRSKVALTCAWSTKVSCGNNYLAAFASKYNSHVIYNPTTIQLDRNVRSHEIGKDARVTIGWTGSHSTLKYLTGLESVISRLIRDFNIRFVIIADVRPISSFHESEFIPWKIESELDDLSKLDIGVMPLPTDEWTLGKCGFKALQYMSLKIPAVVSPVGVNGEIVHHGVNGFVCETNEEWYACLKLLIENPSLRAQMGERGYTTVAERFSVAANASNFLALFE